MTYKEFLAALEATSRNWLVDEAGVIRSVDVRNRQKQCPLTAVAGVRGVAQVEEAAELLGMDPDLAYVIIFNADNKALDDSFDEKTRKELLRACGLS